MENEVTKDQQLHFHVVLKFLESISSFAGKEKQSRAPICISADRLSDGGG